MEPLLPKSHLAGKIRKAGEVLGGKGLKGLVLAVKNYLVYHLDSKWDFVYLEFRLEQEIVSFKTREDVAVKIATPGDLDRIKAEIFPLLEGELAYEKRYFQLLGRPGIRCFLAEHDGRFVHYSWVFEDAHQSPIMDAPFDQGSLRPGDAYVGPIFTDPESRGFIYLQVLSVILRYLKESAECKRTLVLVQGRNPAAVNFYKRMGFREIVNAQPQNVFAYLRTRAEEIAKGTLRRLAERIVSSNGKRT